VKYIDNHLQQSPSTKFFTNDELTEIFLSKAKLQLERTNVKHALPLKKRGDPYLQ